jgi:hypothetical protein
MGEGLVQVVDLPVQNRGYALTERAVRGVPELRARFSLAVAQVSEPIAIHGWQRAALWMAYAEQGYFVGCGPAALAALRLNRREHLRAVATGRAARLIDELWRQLARELGDSEPRGAECRRCRAKLPQPQEHVSSSGTCHGPFRSVDVCPVDVAYKGGECVLLVADHPNVSIQAQLARLPVHVSDYDRDHQAAVYLPKLPVVFIPCEEESVWDHARNKWSACGPRLRRWETYTESQRSHDGFPYLRVIENHQPPAAAVFFKKPAARKAHAYGATA